MDNVVPLAMHYTDDIWRRLLKEATSTFTFKVDMLGRESEQYLTDDAYISFKYNDRQYLFNIMTITPDSGNKSIIVYCENLSLELLNETKAPIDITTSRNLLWYLNNDGLLNNAGITLGINEVSDKTAKIKLDSEQTGLARLTSIANNFDAEIEFVTELNGDGTLKSMTVNFFKKYDGVSQGVGTYRRDLILEYGRNVDGIKRTIDKTDLYNAITPTGKDGLNITSLEKEEYDENGNLEYYTKKGSPNIFAPQSKARYRAQLLNDTDGWLRRNYSADGTSNVNTLYTLALNELKKHAYPAITYEVTGFYDLDIGDTVRIVDHSFTPTLIIQARVAEQSICFSDPTKNKTTFGNILALESRVSQDLTGRLKELVDQVTPYRFEIISDNGLTFKNSTGSTTLTARVYKGSNVEEVSVDSFEWLIDGVSFGGTSKSQLVNASQVTGTAVVRYNAKIGDTVISGLEVTIQDISDGENGISPTVTVNQDTSLTIVDAKGTSTTPVLKGDKGDQGIQGLQGHTGAQGVPGPKGADGKTQYTHIAYANSADGSKDFSTSDSNRTYIGMYVDFNINDSTTPIDYSWTLVKGADGTQGTPGKPGADGKTPYFHTAWSYSADGKKGFTTVYPNFNLLLDSHNQIKSGAWYTTNGGWTEGWGTYLGSKIYRTPYVWSNARYSYKDLLDRGVINTTDDFTYSIYFRVVGEDPAGMSYANICFFSEATTKNGNTPVQLTSLKEGEWARIVVPFKFMGTPYDQNKVYQHSMRVEISAVPKVKGAYYEFAAPKLELGSIATPYMPSEKEAKTSDYPNFIGQYTDDKVSDSTKPSDYTWSLMRGNDGKPGEDGKDGIAGKDGKGIKATAITYQASANGTTAPTGTWSASVPTVAKGSFLWTRTIWTYTDNTTETGYAVAYIGTNGNNGTDGIAGKDGVGIKTTAITYAGSTSGTTAPASGWTSTVPTVAAGSYLWTKTVWAYTDKTSETGYSVARMGLKGDKGDPGIKGSDGTSGIIVSSVAPTSPQTGQLWQDTSTTPQLVKKWTGTSWVIWELYAQNLKADSLETVSAIIGKLSNAYTVDYGAGVHTGTVTIENGMKIVDDVGTSRTTTDFTSQSSGQGMFARYLPDKSDSAKYQQAWYTPFSLRFDDTVNDWHGQITAEQVTLVPWRDLSYLPGFTTYDSNPCQYRKTKNLDGSYTVKFRGQVRPTSGGFANNSTQYIANLPDEIMPAKNAFALGVGDVTSNPTIRIAANANSADPSGYKKLQLRLAGGSSNYVAIDTLEYTI